MPSKVILGDYFIGQPLSATFKTTFGVILFRKTHESFWKS